jgi:hypothetical protein
MAIRKSMVKSVDRMPHPRDKRPLQVLTRSGRYPGWRKCRFTFPHDITHAVVFRSRLYRAQWREPGVNQDKTTSRDFRLTVAGAAQVGTAGIPATLPASRLTARSKKPRASTRKLPRSLG